MKRSIEPFASDAQNGAQQHAFIVRAFRAFWLDSALAKWRSSAWAIRLCYLLLAVAAAYLIAVFITAIWDGQGGTF